MMPSIQLSIESGQETATVSSRSGIGNVQEFPIEASVWNRFAYNPADRKFAVRFHRNQMGRMTVFLEDDVQETSSQDISDWMPSSAVISLRDLYETPVAGHVTSYRFLLNDALRDLEEVKIEAHEEGFPLPSDIALANAGRLLRAMYAIAPRRFEVYPTPDGEIAIDAPSGRGRSVLLLCASDGGALCLVNMNGNHRRARYSTANTLPDGFLREALTDLER